MPPSHSSDSHCHICGAKLDPSILGGSCAACMWSDLISGENEATDQADDAPDIDGYDILEEIGSGGMGVVYRARQHQPDREVALKIVAPYSLRAAQARERFMIEVDAMAAVEHPSLLPLYDAGEDFHGRPWLTMQLAQGGTLAERLDNYSEKWKKAARLIVTLCQAVQYAHERGILHRDLKPANILFDREDNPYIADFGLAKWADEDSSITRSSHLLGSPAYLAPEAAAGGSKVTTTVSDVYGLGAILYELLCGKKPYEGTHAAEILTQILDHPPTLPRAKLANIPRDLEVIAMKAMAREPKKRYHSAAALADDLNRWIDGKAILARPVGLLERMLIWARHNPAPAILSLLLTGSIITGGLLLWKSNQELTAALDDAESQVEFMTRELPPRLEPLGRLDLLDDVFTHVSKHYDRDTRSDPSSLSRHADFLTQWAQVLRPRGQTQASISKLDAALQKAISATEAGNHPLEAARARINAGRRLGEALIENHQLDRAREILLSTIRYSESLSESYTLDTLLTSHIAELYNEASIMEHKDGHLDEALKMAETAQEKWSHVLPALRKKPDSPHYQRALITATRSHHFISLIYDEMDEQEKRKQSLKNHLASARALVDNSPGNLSFRRELVIARQNHVIYQTLNNSITAQDAVNQFIDIDEEITHLVTNAPSNIRWQTDHLANAQHITIAADRMKDEKTKRAWMNILSERAKPLYRLIISDRKFLYAHRRSATVCAEYFASLDWKKSRLHFMGATNIQIQICHLDPTLATHQTLQNGTNNIASRIAKHESRKNALVWLNTQAQEYERQGRNKTTNSLWDWSAAACYALIIPRQDTHPQIHSLAKKRHSLLISATENINLSADISEELYQATEYLLGHEESSEIDRLSLLTTTITALRKMQFNPNTSQRQLWVKLIIKHVSSLPDTSRQQVATLALETFFPESSPNNPLYLQLEKIR